MITLRNEHTPDHNRWIGARALVFVLGVLSCTATGGATSAVSFATPIGDSRSCDPPALTLATDLLGVAPDEVYPGERYPASGTCVFWSRVAAAEFAVVGLDRSDSGPPAWECGSSHLTTQKLADINGTPVLVTACTNVSTPPGNLYQPPEPLTPAPPGTLIWAEQVDDFPLDPPATVWRILYHSRSHDDRDIAVSGFAVVPAGPVPAGGRPVYAWAHGTVGLGDQCAPSHEIRDNLPPYGGLQIERGAVLVATDYEGLGTPGVPTSAVALAEGHAVLDSVRAAAGLPNVGSLGDVVLAGHSQGGRAVLFAAEIAPAYAAELALVGVVALAPGAELPALVDHLAASPYRGAVLIGAIGLSVAYPELDLATFLTPSALADIPTIETECANTTIARYQDVPTSALILRESSTTPDVALLLEQNSPGVVAPAVPVFIGHGDADQQVPVALSETLTATYCALGATVARRVYPGQDHDGVIDAAADDAMTFITDRYDQLEDKEDPHDDLPSTC